MKKRIVCENLRSAYNVGNIIRTADGLGRGVILVGYTAPKEHKKVAKTALGAEESVELLRFELLQDFYDRTGNNQICIVSSEKSDTSISLYESGLLVSELFDGDVYTGVALVMGNEVTGVEGETMNKSNYVIHIPMFGEKESFNVGQAAAIMMWEMNKILN